LKIFHRLSWPCPHKKGQKELVNAHLYTCFFLQLAYKLFCYFTQELNKAQGVSKPKGMFGARPLRVKIDTDDPATSFFLGAASVTHPRHA
jgi:hypothetical protein